MSITLEKIRVSGFKSIRELEIELRELNVLIGANGSGKSNFIALFQLLNDILEKRLQRETGAIGAENLLYYGRKSTEKIEIELSFASHEYSMSLVPSDSDTLIFADEEISFTDIEDIQHSFSLGSGHKETEIFENYGQFSNIVSSIVEFLKSSKIYHFHDTSRNSPMKQVQNLHENERLARDAANIAAYLYLLQEKFPSHYQKIVRTIKRVTPFFDDFVLRPNPLNEEKILLQWHDVNSDKLFNASALSDGTLRFICLATLLMQPDEKLPSVILIDEPELGLHPLAITLLEGMLRSVSAKTQVIISTQSVPLINQFTPEDIIVVERREKQSVFKRLKTEELEMWMTEYSNYGLGDLWEKNVIGGRPQSEFA